MSKDSCPKPDGKIIKTDVSIAKNYLDKEEMQELNEIGKNIKKGFLYSLFELVEINFKQMPSAIDIFAGDLTVDNMVIKNPVKLNFTGFFYMTMLISY